MDEMLMEDEQLMFDSTAIEKVINESLDNILAENMFDESKSQMWINKVAESILSGLQTMNKPFKYATSVFLQQRNGAGLYGSSNCRWEKATDGHCTVSWNNETIQAIITVYGVRI